MGWSNVGGRVTEGNVARRVVKGLVGTRVAIAGAAVLLKAHLGFRRDSQ